MHAIMQLEMDYLLVSNLLEQGHCVITEHAEQVVEGGGY